MNSVAVLIAGPVLCGRCLLCGQPLPPPNAAAHTVCWMPVQNANVCADQRVPEIKIVEISG